MKSLVNLNDQVYILSPGLRIVISLLLLIVMLIMILFFTLVNTIAYIPLEPTAVKRPFIVVPSDSQESVIRTI